jgi:hypothetical protein
MLKRPSIGMAALIGAAIRSGCWTAPKPTQQDGLRLACRDVCLLLAEGLARPSVTHIFRASAGYVAAGSGFDPAEPNDQAIVATRCKILTEHGMFQVP